MGQLLLCSRAVSVVQWGSHHFTVGQLLFYSGAVSVLQWSSYSATVGESLFYSRGSHCPTVGQLVPKDCIKQKKVGQILLNDSVKK